MSAGGEHTNWQVNDLALCVAYGPNPDHWQSDGGPVKGCVYAVVDLDFDSEGLWLNFSEFPDDGWFSLGFRKVTPPAPDEFDTEVIELLNRKPVEA